MNSIAVIIESYAKGAISPRAEQGLFFFSCLLPMEAFDELGSGFASTLSCNGIGMEYGCRVGIPQLSSLDPSALIPGL